MYPDPSIREASDRDIAEVRAWLEQEELAGIHGFLCNWNVILHHHRDHRVHVYIDGGAPIAFLAGGLTRDGVLQVHNSHRARGVGRALVQHEVAAYVAAGRSILVIECAPPTSIPFWQKMGFAIIDKSQGMHEAHYAWRILEIRHQLPAEGKPVDIEIRFFPEDRLRDSSVKPLSTYSPCAVETPNGEVLLSERVAFADMTYERDVVVEIVLQNTSLYLDKAKREAGEDLGIVRCENGFMVDKLYI